MNLSLQQTEHIANLAKLDLSSEEIAKFQKQLSSILEYIDLLNEVDTTNVVPTTQTTGLKNVYRKDEPQKEGCLTQEEVLKNAPEREGGFIKTKAVFG